MPTAPDRRRIGQRGPTAALLALTAILAVTGCGRADPPMRPTTPTTSPTGTASPSGTDTASPDLTASPTGSVSPGGSESPSGSATPGGSVAPVSCSSAAVTPIRIERSTVEPRRTTEVVTVVSDGRNLTPGTREQTDFTSPVLTSPDGGVTVTDEAILAKIVDLIGKSSKNTVLLDRPDAPDTGADTNKRPFNATGTYVLYNASGLLRADVIVQCSDQSAGPGGSQEQRWLFTAEADNTLGTVSCAVEPPKGNAVARQVYGTFC